MSPDARDGSLKIHQSTELWHLNLNKNEKCNYVIDTQRTAYIHIISGSININYDQLYEGDGIMIKQLAEIDFNAKTKVEALLFDIP